MEVSDLRKEIDGLIAAGASETASRCLAELWRQESGPAAAAFTVSRYESLRHRLELRPYRLAILRSFTVEPLVSLLRAAAFTYGIDLTVHVGDFNAYAQEILDGESSLYRFEPDAVILATQTCDIAPDLWRDCADLPPAESRAAVTRVIDALRNLVRTFREHSQAHLIVHTLEQATVPSLGVMDGQSETGQAACIREINRELAHMTGVCEGVYILDYDALVARHGRLHWHDKRKWLIMRMPIAAGHLVHLAEEWLHFIVPLSGKIAKALVVDLDNTLWGGIIGEDGMAGIQIDGEYPGAAYQALQRALLDLYKRGILLAICSKNNFDDAMEVLESHPGMLLRPQHFAAMRINWNDKVRNLREIASELNIGTDALAFLDDNPAERQQARAQLPELTVIDLPSNPAEYAGALRASPVFERLRLPLEDQQRSVYYAAERERAGLERNCSSKEDFYRSLRQEAEIACVSLATLARVAQLTQKTNQFNLTTRRYTEQQITKMAACPGWQAFSLRVRDRYGDNGIVGVAITQQTGEACEIDTFLLSCRVIGRTLETAFLSYLLEQARDQGALRVQGWFLPTKKNAPAKDFYPNHGFHLLTQSEKGLLWALDLPGALVNCPSWISLVAPERKGEMTP